MLLGTGATLLGSLLACKEVKERIPGWGVIKTAEVRIKAGKVF